MTYPSPSTKQLLYSHDSRGRLSGINKTNAPTTSYLSSVAYNPAGQVTSANIGPAANSVQETYTYSANRLQLTNQTVKKSGSSILDLT